MRLNKFTTMTGSWACIENAMLKREKMNVRIGTVHI